MAHLPSLEPLCENSTIDLSPPLILSKGIGQIETEFSPNFTNFIKNWNLLQQEINLPAAVLNVEKVTQNLAWMEEFLSKFKAPILLAPHGKTSMMPKLFNQVCASPSTWGMTLATATQVNVAAASGVSKVLMANQLVGKRNMEIISEIIKGDDNFDFLCLIDSPQNVNQLGEFFKERGQQLKVLIEYGPPTGGRTGVRNVDQEADLLSSLNSWTGTLNLVGVEFFEGVLSKQDQVSEFIDFVTERTDHLLKSGAFLQQNDNVSSSSPIIISGSGSAWFDLVAEKLTSFYESHQSTTCPLQVILRPGCYMIHDVGMYTGITSRIEAKGQMSSKLEPALKIWAYVQSLPEPEVAIIGFGRRDAGNDCGFPVPAWHFRPASHGEVKVKVNVENNIGLRKVEKAEGWELFRMMDQHSFMKIKEGDDIQVGDILIFDIIHVCTTLDKWRHVLVMDNERDMNILDVYQTFF